MKRLFALIVLSIACTTGCASFQAWWQNFQQDPVAQVQTFEQTTAVVLSDLTVGWETIKLFLPPAVLAQAQQQFDNAVASVNHALVALQDVVQAAVDAKNDAPDFSKAIIDVNGAIQEIIAIVNTYRSQQVQPAGAAKLSEPPGLADATERAEHMKHFVVTGKK
jgi:hypothetical protein